MWWLEGGFCNPARSSKHRLFQISVMFVPNQQHELADELQGQRPPR